MRLGLAPREGRCSRAPRSIGRCVSLLLFTGLIGLSCGSQEVDVQGLDPLEGGVLHTSPSGAFRIAELHGTFHQMGRQYGLLLQEPIQAFYHEAVTEFLIGEKGIPIEDLVGSARARYDEFPPLFRDFLDGAAETNGIGKDSTYVLSCALPMIFAGGGCSSLSAWGGHTPDGSAVTGRNLDLPSEALRRFAKAFHVTVWNPIGFPASVASIDLLGGLFYQTAINSKGIFLELQNGQASDPQVPPGRENTNDALLMSLFLHTTPVEVDRWFHTNLPQAGLIMNATFPDHATIYEWATFRVAARSAEGLISATNDFIDPAWQGYPVTFFDTATEGLGYTVTRRTNLLALGEAAPGGIGPERMMEIFDTSIPEGGATFPEGGPVKTIYSVVAKPAELTIWLKVREVSDWEEIDLRPFFAEPS